MFTLKDENQFIIPPDSTFVITTDSSQVPNLPEGGEDNHHSHFSRPEVQAAAMQQALIETPEFAPLQAGAAVGSRLRVRSLSEVSKEVPSYLMSITYALY